MKRVVVIGAGIIGLSCAVRILENIRCEVTIFAKDFSPCTTSDSAGGFWEPYKSEPKDKILNWSKITKQELQKLESEKWPVTTCHVENLHKNPIEEPYFKELLENYKIDSHLRSGYHILSWSAPLVKSTSYMQKLTQRIKNLGGNFVQGTVTDINELLKTFTPKIDILINCMGLGAKTVLNDPELVPIRGVLVLIEPIKSLENRVFNLVNSIDDFPTYVVSREDVCLLGGASDYNSYDMNIHQNEINRIIQNCSKMVPELLENDSIKKIRSTYVGLRPFRSKVRLELEMNTFEIPVIHCYGHGGSGWTVHWGCADEVLQLVKSLIPHHKL